MENAQYTPWSDRLAFDMALLLEGSGEKLDEVVERHNLTKDQLELHNTDPVFLKRISEYREEIQQRGLTFRLKARAQSEMLLQTSWNLIHAPDVSAAVKADLIKSTVKWGGLEPKGDATVEVGGGVRITINLGGETPQTKTITGAVSGKSDELDDDKPKRFLPPMPV